MAKEKDKKQPAVKQKELTVQVLGKVKAFADTGELKTPKDYSPENALKGAMLVLDDMNALEKYDKNSIAQALLKMVVEGLSPLKRQGYFIPYGDQLTWSRSYQGSIALAKRVGGVADVKAGVIYEGDDFQYKVDQETGYRKMICHNQSIDNISNAKIKGAYAVVMYTDGRTDLEVMTIEEIRQAWGQGATKGKSPAHNNFTQEMCKKTVINRACKTPINSSNDLCLMDDEDAPKKSYREEVEEEIEDTTASEVVDFEEVEEEGDGEQKEVNEEAKPGEQSTLEMEGDDEEDDPGF